MLQSIASAVTEVIEWLQRYSGAVQAVFAGLLVLLTIFYVIFTHKLRKATDTLAQLSANQHDLTVISQRAYLAVAPLGIEPFAIASVAHVSVQNVGRLPARDVSWFIDYVVSPNSQLDTFPTDENRFYGRNLVIHPGAKMKRSKDCRLTEDEVRSVRDGHARERVFLYVWGEVRYLDGFAKERRFTRFCHRYDHRGFTVNKDGLYAGQFMLTAESMRYHQFGNDAN